MAPPSIKPTQVRRSQRGGAIVELGPALFILFIVILFPMIDLIMIGFSYMNGMWLQDRLLREAAISIVIHKDPDTSKNPPAITSKDLSCCTSDSDSKLGKIIAAWQKGGLGSFASSTPTQTTTFDPLEGTKFAEYVHVTTNISFNPFMKLPFPGAVPGLNAPMSFTYTGRAVIEDVRNY